jgi:hypothetical protein
LVKHGIDDTSTWSTGDLIIQFAVDRIEHYLTYTSDSKNLQDTDSLTKKIKKVLEGLHLFLKNDGERCWTKEEKRKVDYALKHFGGLLPKLWT